MGAHTARLPDNLEKYVKMLISNGYAQNYGNAINLIVLERMMHDKERGTLSPFEYMLKDYRRSNETHISELETDNVTQFIPRSTPRNPLKKEKTSAEIVPKSNNAPLGDAPHTGDPLTPSADAGISTTSEPSPFGAPRKTPYPGTRAEYEEALRRGKIINGMFEPPEA